MSAATAQTLSMVIVVVFALTVIFVRLRAANQPTSLKKILIPPLGMSTGFLMFISSRTHMPWTYALSAIIVGAAFSIPLIQGSRMEVRADAVFLKRSKGFVIILFILLVLRVALHHYIERYVTIPQTGALFFVLAFSMLLPWRAAMAWQYLKLRPNTRTQAQ